MGCFVTLHLVESTLLRLFRHANIGALYLTTSDGHRHDLVGASVGVTAAIRLLTPDVGQYIARLGIINGLAKAYTKGLWTTQDIQSTVLYLTQNMLYIAPHLVQPSWRRHVDTVTSWCAQRIPHTTHTQAHHTMRNAFYEAWLGNSMSLTTGFFLTDDDTLEVAHTNKYHHLLKALPTLSIHDHILDIGCQWGGFAAYFTKKHKAQYTGVPASLSQERYTLHRLSPSPNATITRHDMRPIQGRFDHIVSIETLQTRPICRWDGYFKTIKRRLKPNGRAIVHSIILTPQQDPSYATGYRYLYHHLYPKAALPTLEAITTTARKHFLTIEQCTSFGHHYIRTLNIWQDSFRTATDSMTALGITPEVQRLWGYYLAYLQAGFMHHHLDMVEVVLTHDTL
jgi:cyclopropane-fatty-acyl-phospholipid synthase